MEDLGGSHLTWVGNNSSCNERYLNGFQVKERKIRELKERKKNQDSKGRTSF